MSTQNNNKKNTKTSHSRQTRAIMLERSKRPVPAPTEQEIEQLLNQLIEPAILNLTQHYQSLGLRCRTLTLPVMVCFLISLIWRQLGSVSAAVRELNQYGQLWQPALKVSQQAVSERLRELPASLFESILREVLSEVQKRSQARQRPLPKELQKGLAEFKQIVAVDASSLDALIKKVGLLRETEQTVLGGRMLAMLDLRSQLPTQVWYEEDSYCHEQNWWEQICESLPSGALLLFDLGFVNYGRYAQLSSEGKYFISRVKSRMVHQVLQKLSWREGQREWLIQVKDAARQPLILRQVEIEYAGKWYSYVTNVLELERLSGTQIAELYRQRWRIEDAFKTVKRLLGLAYFYGSSQNAILLQLWTTWLMYSVLIDLSDEVAEELELPLSRISVEMVYLGLGHISRVRARGLEVSVVQYLATNAKLLGIVKRPRPRPKPDLTFPLIS
ncbi:MAG: IS4 family transposase [Chloroflexi bacterium]|uniref:IS4 family transposase n=1 Tax=Candidatus Chlorohelix allophototropha TaxID=3003348 RepID=A0A8T7M5V8_9CHLR|nr:IS4 family transposase [Chloroflexota bacterium]WJW69386.1 IS4 family transposase [Chloroflexota bacterium L227-S17]